MSTKRDILQAKADDVDLIAEILGEAFYNDPITCYAAGRKGFARDLFELSFRHLYAPLNHSFYMVNETGQAMGCALWAHPEEKPSSSILPLLKLGWEILNRAGGKAFIGCIKIANFMDANHLQEPHYYLHAIGVKQAFQGQGVGSRLLAHGLEIADREQKPAFLENTKERNLPIYQKYGFEVIEQKYLPDDGPPVWFMRRSPC